MKRLWLGLAIVSGAAILGGCPIYSTSGDYAACSASGQCFDCPSGSSPSDGTCVPWQCSSSGDCPSGYACSANSCMAAADCSGGCASGYVCKLAGGLAQCVPSGRMSSDAGNGSNQGAQGGDATAADSGAASDGGSSVPPDGSVIGSDASYPPDVFAASSADAAKIEAASTDSPYTLDSSDAAAVIVTSDAAIFVDSSDASLFSDVSVDSLGVTCNAIGDCGGGGAKCIDGRCAPESHLCSDSTQCVTTGESCVDGVCEPHCSVTAPCPGGYECDFTRGVCNVNPGSCSGSGTSTCQGASECVEGHCVPPCAATDAGGACPSGQVCVNGGCIPDEAAQFSCKNDGQSGQLATACTTTSVCVHHDCYAGCDPDAGATACADPAASCKAVTVAAGTYDVCGTPSSLGSDCDPAVGRYCTGAVCIDGYCR
jgi:hypothetical protein